MVVLNRIYTRSGDAGETALGDGRRVGKDAARVEAYGTVDELNAVVGLARLAGGAVEGTPAEGTPAEAAPAGSAGEIDAALGRIQNELFDLGADLCRPEMARDAEAEYTPLRMVPGQVDRLEAEIDAMNAALAPLRSFVLPGGSALAAHLHHCRTVCRRAERLVVRLAREEEVNPAAIRYLNRLSDWFFVASRAANDNGARDVLWVPGQTR
ncbi:cob(I)yrinic acid a,c-diamide adenosyltransferase [Paralimibaculum aggregatum]|uniref:Corrinoid adenosyltransferase n=1 Tax=Paralimibaculum aggregatum TaxID=3036245 RepID=A0ABQ6LHS9_9RHOB|nr:cob(I)yrinic acid a,c-diamide adenosyltransferase [Limibaculum sp. NKW23]GMG82847.1 cob(I)yrinic acid a,c-diamide adenosyltransferase [Limibaculum sp. NKW23]